MFDIDRLCFVVCSTKKIKLGNRRLNKNNHKTPHLLTAGAEFFSLDSFEKCAEFIGMHRENSHQRRWLSSCGQNYLHLLCQCCPKVETIRPLLELDPNAIKEPDANGCLPIHVAMTNGASHSVLSLLIEKYPHSVKMKNKWGYTAFDWIVNRCLYELSCTFSTATCFRRDIWRTLEVLIKAMSGNIPSCTDKSLLQMTFEFQCPVLLTRAILSEFPSMATWKDDKGRVALATALNAPRSNMVPIETIQLLVVINPKMLLVRDNNGRIPFHIAIDTNKDWNILKFMLQYEPECMQCRDGWTGLYPFMLLSTKAHVTLSELYEAVTFCVDTVQ